MFNASAFLILLGSMKWKESTIELRLARDAPKIEVGGLFSFLENKLGIDLDNEVHCVQPEYKRRCVSVCLKSKERCEEIAALDDGTLSINNNKVSVEYSGSTKLVRVLDVPWRMPHSVVMSVLSQYGTPVNGMEFEYWKRNNKTTKISNGTRVVRMVLKRAIPNYVSVQGITAVVKYPDQPSTCALCNSTGHFVKECPKKKEKAARTWASVAGGPRSPPPTPLDPPDLSELLSTNMDAEPNGVESGPPSPSLSSGEVLAPLSPTPSRRAANRGELGGAQPSQTAAPCPSPSPLHSGSGAERGHDSISHDDVRYAIPSAAADSRIDDTHANGDSSQTTGEEYRPGEALMLALGRFAAETSAGKGVGGDTAGTADSKASSQFDWAEESLKENFLTLSDGDGTQDGRKKPTDFFVNASPLEDDVAVDPFSSTFLGVLEAKRKREEEEKKEEKRREEASQKSEEEQEKQGEEQEANEEEWEEVRRSERGRAKSTGGIPGLAGGSRKPLTPTDRLRKALAAPNKAAAQAHVSRIKRQRSDLTKNEANKKSKDTTPK